MPSYQLSINESKEILITQLPIFPIVFAGIGCGILMFLAVYCFAKVENQFGKCLLVVFPVSTTVFIYSAVSLALFPKLCSSFWGVVSL